MYIHLYGYKINQFCNCMYIHTFVLSKEKMKNTNQKTQTKKHKKMKNTILILALTMLQLNAGAKEDKVTKAMPVPTNWTVDASHSNVKFSVTHLVVSTVDGNFKTFSGNVIATNPDFTNANVSFKIDVNTVNTDNEARDKHLKSDDFFNAEKYQNMSFTSTSFKKVKGNYYVLEGNLTIRDITKKVKFAVIYGGTAKDPWGGTRAGFRASTNISRKEFGLKWNKTTEAGGAVLGDDVTVNLNVELMQQKA